MQCKALEWSDYMDDNGEIKGSYCLVRIYEYSITIKFVIKYDEQENIFYLQSFGQGSVRRLMPDPFPSVEEAKIGAYKIYSNELLRLKSAIDSFFIENE